MKFHVNENCIGCGLCNGTCPAVFEMTDSGVAQALDIDVDGATAASAIEAMDGCPASAIEKA
jgi:ferredoxin